MKQFIIVLIIIVMSLGTAFARLIMWPHTKQPPLPMYEALGLAEQALGSDTNKFYCVRANPQIAFTRHGEWLFGFCSTNGTRKDVVIPFDKTENPRVINGGIVKY